MEVRIVPAVVSDPAIGPGIDVRVTAVDVEAQGLVLAKLRAAGAKVS